MNDSADMKIAADRLQIALRSLEAALDPLLTRVSGLETALNESKALACLLYTSPSPRDATLSRMPSSA